MRLWGGMILLFLLGAGRVEALTIDVRLFRRQAVLSVDGQGISISALPSQLISSTSEEVSVKKSSFLTASQALAEKYQATALPEGIFAKKDLPLKIKRSNDMVIIVTAQGRSYLLADRILLVQGQQLKVNGVLSPQKVQIHLHKAKGLDVVAALPMFEYLEGVLPAEMPASWPEEALKAQAVASRTYAIEILQRRQQFYYDVDASVSDQMYKYFGPSHLSEPIRQKIRDAVKQTKNEVLTVKNGVPIRAFFHADCGGHTESADDVWQDANPSRVVQDAGCPLSPHAQWTLVLDQALFNKTLKQFFPEAEFKQVQLKISSRSQSGRVAGVEISYKGQKRETDGQSFRKWIGFNRVKSTQFDLKFNGQHWLIFGRGHGHGVGMCQWGARYLSKRGIGYKDILKHYYPNAKIRRDFAGSSPQMQASF